MEPLHFLIQSSLIWSISALFYSIMLKKETFFQHNRLFLLISAAMGLVYPFFSAQISALSGISLPLMAALPEFSFSLSQKTTQAGGTLLQLLWYGYWLGAGILAARTAWGLVQLARMRLHCHQVVTDQGVMLVYTNQVRWPVSFFRYIFLPIDFQIDTNESQAILAHERAHVRGFHSLDVLLMECLCIFCWFHPLVHWYRATLRQTHEYLADASAVQSNSRKQYGLLLIRQANTLGAFSLAHHFFQSPLKSRLQMLLQTPSRKPNRWKYLLALPVFLLALAACNKEIIGQDNSSEILSIAELDVKPTFPGGQVAMFKFIQDNLKYPADAKSGKIEEKVIVTFVIQKDGSIQDIQALKEGYHPSLLEETIRVIKTMPPWVAGEKNGRKVAVKFALPIRFALE